MAVDREDPKFFDFMCSCNESGKMRCDDTYKTVKESFGGIEDEHFMTHIVYSLENLDNGHANIEHICADMWAGVAVTYECYSDDCEPVKFWVECDGIHHGIARIYQLVQEYDKSVATGPDG